MSSAAEDTVLAFDFGLRRVGVAVGHPLTGSATPLRIVKVRNNKPDWSAIAALVDEWRPGCFVVGLSRHEDGSDSPVTSATRAFARRLEGRFGRPVELIDERLSSWEAAQRAGRSEDLDAVAAQAIFDTWLAEQSS